MATKKTSTKAKTNTRKAASSAKTTTRTTSTKSTVTTKKVVRSGIERLLELQRISAGVFLLLALFAGYYIKNTTVNLTLGFMTKDDLASHSSTVFAQAVHGVYDINVRWIVVGIMVLCAILPALWSLRWRRQYEVNVDAEVMPQRWIDTAVTFALIVETIALLSGTHEIMTLKLVGGLVVLWAGLSWLADRENRIADRAKWSAYVFGLVAGYLPWVFIGVGAVATYVWGMVRAPWYVYALYASTLGGMLIMSYLQRKQYRSANQWKFEVLERNYSIMNLLIKAAFALILIAGLHK